MNIVLLSGGSGKRLWPLSNDIRSKQFIKIFKKEENDCYMYKVVDVKLTRTFIERIFGLGTITCITGDSTDAILLIKHIKKSKEIKDYILEASEQARLKRRTVNMLDIGAGDMTDVEPDSFTN